MNASTLCYSVAMTTTTTIRSDADVQSYRIERDGDILGYASKRTAHTTWTLDTANGQTLLATADSLPAAAAALSAHREWERNH